MPSTKEQYASFLQHEREKLEKQGRAIAKANNIIDKETRIEDCQKKWYGYSTFNEAGKVGQCYNPTLFSRIFGYYDNDTRKCEENIYDSYLKCTRKG